jgi:hypothetical protein
VSALVAELNPGARQALSLFALTESTVWPLVSLRQALVTLGVNPDPAIVELLDRGLFAADAADPQLPVDTFERWIDASAYHPAFLRVHPSVPQAVRVVRPQAKLPTCTAPVVQIRESDGLEPVLRLGALWQRVGVEPLRQTQQGTLYKRDQERLDQDPVLADGVSDALALLPALSEFWLMLARRVGLVRLDSAGEQLEAAAPDFWADNAVHLPQMIATAWLGLRSGPDCPPETGQVHEFDSPVAYLRPALLLWLATLEAAEWTALDDLAEHLRQQYADWEGSGERRDAGTARRGGPARGRADSQLAGSSRGKRVVSSVLLGAGYALGLVRAGEEQGTGRVVVQLTALGRYVLTLGTPAPRPLYEHFLFVQPNLEIIAYRQGLTPQLIGLLSRFAWWTRIGAALELKLTQESINLGLESGQTPAEMIDLLTRHSQRPLPTIVPDAIGRWASHRERITFYAAATLIEFASIEERDQAFAAWTERDAGAFVPVADRFLLVDNPQRIPSDRIRTRGSRDYRHPPERCVSIEPDGITLAVDGSRSDLLIDAEIARVAEELPGSRIERNAVGTEVVFRKFRVTAASIGKAIALGIMPSQIVDWFERRSGEPPSPAIRLLIRSASAAPVTMNARRLLVLTTPTPELADGLAQHPATRDLVGQRLGPSTLALPEGNLDSLERALEELGIHIRVE